MDRERLERDLRAMVDLILAIAPAQLVNLDLAALIAKLGPAGPTLARLVGIPTSGTWDLRATLYGACSRIAQLDDAQLTVVVGIVQRECDALLTADATPASSPTPAEWDAIAAVLDELRQAVSI